MSSDTVSDHRKCHDSKAPRIWDLAPTCESGQSGRMCILYVLYVYYIYLFICIIFNEHAMLNIFTYIIIVSVPDTQNTRARVCVFAFACGWMRVYFNSEFKLRLIWINTLNITSSWHDTCRNIESTSELLSVSYCSLVMFNVACRLHYVCAINKRIGNINYILCLLYGRFDPPTN